MKFKHAIEVVKKIRSMGYISTNDIIPEDEILISIAEVTDMAEAHILKRYLKNMLRLGFLTSYGIGYYRLTPRAIQYTGIKQKQKKEEKKEEQKREEAKQEIKQEEQKPQEKKENKEESKETKEETKIFRIEG